MNRDDITRVMVEVCAESVESAIAACKGGAYRVELCDNMAEGGTTPSYGQILVARSLIDIKLYPIIRPRGGDFCYTPTEFEAMKRDAMLCGEAGCDGIVTGILTRDGRVDAARCAELAAITRDFGMGISFHRAFDMTLDLQRALEDIIGLGFERVLTSGGMATAEEGADNIRRLVGQAGGRITVMPGSGITPENAARIIERTGCTEIHGTFRTRRNGSAQWVPEWADQTIWHTDEQKVRRVVAIAENY